MAPTTSSAALNRIHDAVREMTQQLEAVSAMPQETLEDLKSSVDDVRFRLWGLLMAVNSKDYKAFSERFRLRRMAEICQGILDDADAGRMSLTHTEAGPLGVVARELGRRITEAHTR
jgi:hypothetical protein